MKKLPENIKAGVDDMIGGLLEVCKGDRALAGELLSGEDETKATRAVLKSKIGGDVQYMLGYLNGVAECVGCEVAELLP